MHLFIIMILNARLIKKQIKGFQLDVTVIFHVLIVRFKMYPFSFSFCFVIFDMSVEVFSLIVLWPNKFSLR